MGSTKLFQLSAPEGGKPPQLQGEDQHQDDCHQKAGHGVHDNGKCGGGIVNGRVLVQCGYKSQRNADTDGDDHSTNTKLQGVWNTAAQQLPHSLGIDVGITKIAVTELPYIVAQLDDVGTIQTHFFTGLFQLDLVLGVEAQLDHSGIRGAEEVDGEYDNHRTQKNRDDHQQTANDIFCHVKSPS